MTRIADRRNALLAQFPTWPDLTVAGLFDRAADMFPLRPFIITGERYVTYREAQAVSRAMASGLVASGLQPGDHVALVMANMPEFIFAKLAIARTGGVAVPVNYQLRFDEMHYVVGQSQSRFLIGMDWFRDRNYAIEFIALQEGLAGLEQVFVCRTGGGTAIDIPGFDDLVEHADPVSDAELTRRETSATGTALSDIVFTSGTTGYPKGAMLTHDMVLRAAFSSALTRGFEDGRRIQFALPMYHVFGYVECWIAALFVGGAVIPHAKFDAAEMLDWAVRLEANDMVCVPTMTSALIVEAREQGFLCPSLRSFFNSGGVNPPSIWAEIRKTLGAVEIHTAYGMTESTASAMCTRTDDGEACLLDTNGRAKIAGPAGDPELGNWVAKVRVVDPQTGEELPEGFDGELQIRGPIVTRGYFGKPEETKNAITADGWLRTGDLGRLLEGGFMRLTGRIKETYRCGGEMVMPREIEELLANYPGVAQVHVVGIADNRMGEVGCLCIVPLTGAVPDTQAMIALCAERLARFKVPRHVVMLDADEIPLTATGRPQKYLLAKMAATRI